MNEKEGYDFIQKLIQTYKDSNYTKPFTVTRYGIIESALVGKVYYNQSLSEFDRKYTQNNAGIFFKDKYSIDKYCQAYLDSVYRSSLFTYYDAFTNLFTKHIINETKMPIAQAQCLEPFYFMDQDSYNFDKLIYDMRVLIISSHSDTMKEQVKSNNIDNVFNKKIWNKNNLLFMKPPVTLGQNHNNKDWSEHFEEFKTELDKIKDKYDIAFVSAGGYGILICDYMLTHHKKSAIYVGGALQILFGIKGARWDSKGYYNTHWVNVLPSDTPKNYKTIEDGCYW